MDQNFCLKCLKENLVDWAAHYFLETVQGCIVHQRKMNTETPYFKK